MGAVCFAWASKEERELSFIDGSRISSPNLSGRSRVNEQILSILRQHSPFLQYTKCFLEQPEIAYQRYQENVQLLKEIFYGGSRSTTSILPTTVVEEDNHLDDRNGGISTTILRNNKTQHEEELLEMKERLESLISLDSTMHHPHQIHHHHHHHHQRRHSSSTSSSASKHQQPTAIAKEYKVLHL